ncbi:MAG TPA: hypothetical protein VHG09_07040 [Longimicrobiales bacterium]|nr:hypothetical protein [Longimicrobiales bacterium]
MVKRRSGRWTSIEWKLPLLITALLLVLVVFGSWAAYREVRRSALETSRTNLERAAGNLAGLLDTGVEARAGRMELLGRNGDIRAALQLETRLPEAEEALYPLLTEDSLPVELRRPDGTPIARVGRFPSGWTESQIDSVRRNAPERERGYSEIRVVDGNAYIWIVAPVRADGSMRGAIAHLLEMGDSGSDAVQELLGPGRAVYYVNRSGGPWISLEGEVVDAPFPDPAAAPPTYERPNDGTRATAFIAPAGTSPIAIVAEAPLERVLAAPHSFLVHSSPASQSGGRSSRLNSRRTGDLSFSRRRC